MGGKEQRVCKMDIGTEIRVRGEMTKRERESVRQTDIQYKKRGPRVKK